MKILLLTIGLILGYFGYQLCQSSDASFLFGAKFLIVAVILIIAGLSTPLKKEKIN